MIDTLCQALRSLEATLYPGYRGQKIVYMFMCIPAPMTGEITITVFPFYSVAPSNLCV